MAEGNLAANGTATVTLDDRVVQVIVSAAGGELWVTTDGSNPDYPKPGAVRVIPQRSPQAIPVSSLADPTVVKLRSPNGADYTVTAGTQTDADSGVGMGATPEPGTYEPAGAVATHDAETTSVHGITDTEALATLTDVTDAVDAHDAADDPHPDYLLETAALVVAANRQTDSYTLVLGDAGLVVEMNKATANNLTVPLNATVAFPVGTILEVFQYGAGQTTIVATGGVTVRSSGGKLKLTGQYSGASLRKIAADEWCLIGDISA